MFNDFCTELEIRGVVEVMNIEPIQEFQNNKNIRVEARTCRRRVNDGKIVKDYDTVYLKFWASGAEYIEEHVAAGDVLLVRGEIRGKSPTNNDLRVKSFEILTPSEDTLTQFVEQLNG